MLGILLSGALANFIGYGCEKKKTTEQQPPVISELSPPANFQAAIVNCDLVELKWDTVSSATSYEIFRDNNLLVEVTAPPYQDKSVNESTAYVYSIRSKNDKGVSQKSPELNVTTPQCPTNPPSTPTGLNATVISCSQIDLTWDAVTTATSYEIYRNGTKINSVTSPNYSDTGLQPNTTYSYTVSACNNAGCSPDTSSVTETTSGPPNIPSAPTFGQVTCDSIVVNWNTVSGATYYDLYRGGNKIASPTSPPYTDSGLSSNTSYTYTISACATDCGCSAQSSSSTQSTTGPPGIPSTPTVSNPTCSSLTVSWSAVTGASSYNLYRNGTLIQSGITTTSYTDTGLASNTTYSYTVSAINSCGTSSQGPSGSGTTTGVPNTPGAPTVSNPTCNSLQISWSAVSGAASYQLFRNGVQIANPTTTSYTDTGLSSGTTYSYALKACNSCGCSSTGTNGSGTTTGIPGTPSPPSGTPGCTSVFLTWSAVTGASSYNIYRNATQIGSSTTTSYTDSGLSQGNTYFYTISACNSCGCSSQSSSASVTTLSAPSTPSAPTLSNVTSGSITVSWTSVAGATSYSLQRNGTTIANPSTSPYNDTGLTPNTNYCYRVAAVNSCGTSAYSTQSCATTCPETPTLLSPGDNASSETPFTFSWTSAAGATQYEFKVCFTPGLDSCAELLDDPNVFDTTFNSSGYWLGFTLSDFDTLYWGVRAFNGCWGSWSTAWRFNRVTSGLLVQNGSAWVTFWGTNVSNSGNTVNIGPNSGVGHDFSVIYPDTVDSGNLDGGVFVSVCGSVTGSGFFIGILGTDNVCYGQYISAQGSGCTEGGLVSGNNFVRAGNIIRTCIASGDSTTSASITEVWIRYATY